MLAMAAFQRPEVRTASLCTAEAVRGTHSFKIAGYSLYKGLGVGNFIKYAVFAIGGHEWFLNYYPDGADENLQEYAGVSLKLISKHVEVRVEFNLRLIDPGTQFSVSIYCFRNLFDEKHPSWGIKKFKKTIELEASYLQDDCLIIECDLTVIKEVHAVEIDRVLEIQVPPSDLSDNLGKFLESGEGANVTFEVKEEVFRAHKFILAARSPVFKAKFYGMMMDKEMKSITIEDMESVVFKAFLHFVYKDSLPVMNDVDGDENEEMVKHFLVVADMYGVERMKLICESIICKRLDVESVAATFAIADQHHCSKLKDACIAFINSTDRINDVVASQGYKYLKRVCPTVLVDAWEKAAKCRKI